MDAITLSLDVPENPDRARYDEQREETMKSYRLVVPWSGGLDSTAALCLAWQEHGSQVIAMPMNLGQRWDNAEARNRSFLRRVLKRHGIGVTHLQPLAVPTMDETFDHIQVGRNFNIADTAADYVQRHGWGEVWLAWYQGEIPVAWGDKSVAALTLMNHYHGVLIYTPWRHHTKGQILRWLCSRGLEDVARQTYSCFTGQNVPCGKCRACWNTYVAWVAIGRTSSLILPWLLHADFDEQVARYRRVLAERPRDYGADRTAELTAAMAAWEAEP